MPSAPRVLGYLRSGVSAGSETRAERWPRAERYFAAAARQQASRVSDYTVFLYLGEVIEEGNTKTIFENPQHELTEQYITGEFG